MDKEAQEKIAHIELADHEGITVDGVPDYIRCGAIGLDKVEQAIEFADQILALYELPKEKSFLKKDKSQLDVTPRRCEIDPPDRIKLIQNLKPPKEKPPLLRFKDGWCKDPPTLAEPDRPLNCPEDCRICKLEVQRESDIEFYGGE